VSDEGDDGDNEASSCDPNPTSLAREFIESRNCEEENEEDGSGGREEDEMEIPERCGCSKRCFLLFAQSKN